MKIQQQQPQYEPPDWMNKAETLDAIKRSERSLDRLVNSGRIERRQRPRPGKPPEPMFKRSDVERLTAVNGFVVPARELDQRQNGQTTTLEKSSAAVAQLFAPFFLQMLSASAASGVGQASLQTPLQWVTIEAAAQYTGLSIRKLRSLIRSGHLPADRDGRKWKIRRDDLDKLYAQGLPPEVSGRKVRIGAGASLTPAARVTALTHNGKTGREI